MSHRTQLTARFMCTTVKDTRVSQTAVLKLPISISFSVYQVAYFERGSPAISFPRIVRDLVIKPNLVHNFSYYVYYLVYLSISVFRATMYAGWNFIPPCIPWESSVTSTKDRINSCFSWWWAHSRPKHVEIDIILRNKRTKKNCAPRWLYLQDYTGMHGQQNIKFVLFVTLFHHISSTRWSVQIAKNVITVTSRLEGSSIFLSSILYVPCIVDNEFASRHTQCDIII